VEIIEVISEMADGTTYFRKELPFEQVIQGSVNGQEFTVKGKGRGNAQAGNMKGKWECTSGKLPMSWPALATTLGYGFKCFANFPNGLTHFFQECMPEGYTQERVTNFQDDGTLKTYHEIYLEKGIVMNKVTLKGESFKPGSPVLNNGIECMLPTVERTVAHKDGVKSFQHGVYPLKEAGGEYIVATQTTINRPISKGKNVTVPLPHFTRTEIKQSRHSGDDSDHVIQEEVTQGYQQSLLDYSL